MTAVAETLTASESDLLAICEEKIAHGLKTFIETGNALADVRENRLYRVDFATFEDYCQERWGFTDSRARQLIAAAATVTNVTAAGLPAPVNEGQARELGKVPQADQADVWARTVEQTAGKPTAAAVRAAATPQTPDAAPSVEAETLPPASGIQVGGETTGAGMTVLPPTADLDGEALFEDQEQADRRRDEELDSVMADTATRFRRNFSSALAGSTALWNFEPDRIAEVYGADFDHSVRAVLDQMAAWTEKVYAARRRTASGLRLVAGGGGK